MEVVLVNETRVTELGGISGKVLHGRGMSGAFVSDALARGLQVPAMWSRAVLCSWAASPLRVQGVSISSVLDRGDNLPQDSDTGQDLVLGDLPDGKAEERDIYAVASKDAQDQDLQDHLDHGTQDTQGHGRQGRTLQAWRTR